MRRTIVVFLAVLAGPAHAAPTGVLDLELDPKGAAFVLHDAAYAVTFPGKPDVQTMTYKFHGDDVPGATASATVGDGSYGFLVKPLPKDWIGASNVALDNVRDGFVTGAKAKLTSERATKLGGLAGRHLSAVVSAPGQTVYLEAELLWDAEHRVVVGLITSDLVRKRSATAQAFVASLTVQRGARGPSDPEPPAEGVATKTGAADLELVRHGARYVVRDAAAEVTFPRHPTFRTYMTTPVTVVGAEADAEEVEALGFSVVVVAAGDAYDAVKGRDGGRDGWLADWTNEHHTETKAKVGGLDGTRIVVTGTLSGVRARGELRIAWDPRHRRLYSVLAATSAAKLSAAATAFLDSLAIAK